MMKGYGWALELAEKNGIKIISIREESDGSVSIEFESPEIGERFEELAYLHDLEVEGAIKKPKKSKKVKSEVYEAHG